MYLRDCALGKKIIVVKGVDEVANELRKIGNNLNQLTRAVNSGYCFEVDLRETGGGKALAVVKFVNAGSPITVRN